MSEIATDNWPLGVKVYTAFAWGGNEVLTLTRCDGCGHPFWHNKRDSHVCDKCQNPDVWLGPEDIS